MRNIVIAIGVLGLIAMGCSKKEKPAGAGTLFADRAHVESPIARY